MLKTVKSLYLLFTFVICSCAHDSPKIVSPTQSPPTNTLAIGLLADTQFQSTHPGIQATTLNSGWADIFSNSARRTAAQVKFAGVGLKLIAEEAHKKGAQVFFYLGDALNNGCKDELQRLIDAVLDIQKFAPVFLAMGNHDYLAAGMTTTGDLREATCGIGNTLSKYEIANAFEQINQASLAILRETVPSASYVSSFPKMECNVVQGVPIEDVGLNCFFAFVLSMPDTLFLIGDSSHYDQNAFLNVSTSELDELKGINGWIQQSQVDFLTRHIQSRADTVFLTHYSPADFSSSYALMRFFLPELGFSSDIGPVADLFFHAKLLSSRLHWYWAHTHDSLLKTSITSVRSCKKKTRLRSIANGSTTDYPNYGTVVFPKEEPPQTFATGLCDFIERDPCTTLWSTTLKENADKYGLTRDYRRYGSYLSYYKLASNYLDSLVWTDYGFSDEEAMQACLLHIAGYLEKGEFPQDVSRDRKFCLNRD
ncbi:metallophosphoesterase family protein [Microvenator marinus]|uniref:metallophosphoesterase family protein n=1 Tax=Microvenator marinus TaxID=2600177 RepID=UPI00201B66BD|nr:metallophosphoesterase family protein [Microvenator marinus]